MLLAAIVMSCIFSCVIPSCSNGSLCSRIVISTSEDYKNNSIMMAESNLSHYPETILHVFEEEYYNEYSTILSSIWLTKTWSEWKYFKMTLFFSLHAQATRPVVSKYDWYSSQKLTSAGWKDPNQVLTSSSRTPYGLPILMPFGRTSEFLS